MRGPDRSPSPRVVLGRRRASTYAAYAPARLLPASYRGSGLGPVPLGGLVGSDTPEGRPMRHPVSTLRAPDRRGRVWCPPSPRWLGRGHGGEARSWGETR